MFYSQTKLKLKGQHRVKVIPSINGDAEPVKDVFIREQMNFHQQVSGYIMQTFIHRFDKTKYGLHTSPS